ncbi:MAG: Na/Pi symporter, partial [Clostridia bacterium]|nr:Na/Pi symporter [Clostridia bacterium]
GANIGTTITAQITALQSLPITPFLTALACVGAFMAMFGKDKVAKAGMLISGIGIIFVGMKFMSMSMDEISRSDAVINLLSSVTNPLLLMLIGLVFTAIFQSSAATTSILITLCSVNIDTGGQLMTLQSAIFVTLGINIGTCVTAMLASIGANTNAKRASVIHLLFNVFGTAIFMIFIFVAPLISEKLAIHYWLAKAFPNVVSTQIAMFHTIFNILSTLILLPFTGGLTKLATLLVRDKKTQQDQESETEKFEYIDERILKSPAIAIMVLRKELLSMAFLAKTNFDLAIDTLAKLNFDRSQEFADREKRIDFLNKKLTKFAVKISAKDISYKEEKEIASFYHVISDIERVGDYAENICESAQELVDNNLNFSETAIEEIMMMKGAIDKLYEYVMTGFEQKSMAVRDEVNGYEDLVDTYEEDLSKNHIVRLHNSECSAESGGIFLSVISNMERIADHFRNVFKSMSTYVSQVKTKANVKEETPLSKINNENVRILPSANAQSTVEENKEATTKVSTNNTDKK